MRSPPTDCGVVSETPPDFEFGKAAVGLSVLFGARPLTKDGQATAGRRVEFTIRFNLG